MITPPAVTASNSKGFKRAMQIEQVHQNHFKFSEENKPPETKVDDMELAEKIKGGEREISDEPMQEDSEMGMEPTPSNVPPS